MKMSANEIVATNEIKAIRHGENGRVEISIEGAWTVGEVQAVGEALINYARGIRVPVAPAIGNQDKGDALIAG